MPPRSLDMVNFDQRHPGCAATTADDRGVVTRGHYLNESRFAIVTRLKAGRYDLSLLGFSPVTVRADDRTIGVH